MTIADMSFTSDCPRLLVRLSVHWSATVQQDIRSTACSRDAIVSVSKGKSAAIRHVAVLRFAAPGVVTAASASAAVTNR
jgi:hypothetical protein